MCHAAIQTVELAVLHRTRQNTYIFHFLASSRSVAMVAAELLSASRTQNYNITLKPPCTRCLSMTLYTDFKMSFTFSISQVFTTHDSL